MVEAGRIWSNIARCTAPIASASPVDVMNIRVRTTSAMEAPDSLKVAAMISKHRRAWRPASSGHVPSGHTGPVPDTRTRSPTWTARLNPMIASNGEPEEMRTGSLTPRVWHRREDPVPSDLLTSDLDVRGGGSTGSIDAHCGEEPICRSPIRVGRGHHGCGGRGGELRNIRPPWGHQADHVPCTAHADGEPGRHRTTRHHPGGHAPGRHPGFGHAGRARDSGCPRRVVWVPEHPPGHRFGPQLDRGAPGPTPQRIDRLDSPERRHAEYHSVQSRGRPGH